MASEPALGLFEAVGVELEYMIVDRDRLDVLPICDQVMLAEAGRITSDVEFDDVTWSNELVLHVIELKTTEPARSLAGLAASFQEHVGRINRRLAPLGGRLMPTAMHPWMDPHAQMRLWPHDCSDIYDTFHRIFDCRGHGWANLQSMHVNLPFDGDEQFARLHAAIRLVLPILPALAASSPVVDGRVTAVLDNRLEAYRVNTRRIASVAGRVIPEPVFSAADYQAHILQRIYDDLAPHDPAGVVRFEWSNARGAIARFDRNTIEIRVIDVQECPAADLAVAAAAVGAVKLLAGETTADLATQQAWPLDPLADLFEAVIRQGERAVIDNTDYLRTFGLNGSEPCTAGQLWRHVIERVRDTDPSSLAFCDEPLAVILEQGPLARRLVDALGLQPSHDRLLEVYRRLCDCLAQGVLFTA